MVPQPTLYVLATNHKFEEIVNKLSMNETSSLEWTDFHGNTVLHILCGQHRMSQKAIDAVLQKRPMMAGLPNQASWTPLHLACQRRIALSSDPYIDSIRLSLIHACPSAVSKRRESGYARETALDFACAAGASISVLEAMLQVDPLLARPQNAVFSSKTPIQTLWNAGLKDHVALLLLTALFGRVIEDRRSFLLHAACFQRIHPDCLDYFLETNFEQLLVQDHLGNLPIHYAVSQQKEHTALAFTEYAIASLISLAPQAALIPNHEGRLPIHCALDHPHVTWHKGGLRHLAPLALMTRDPRTRLYPFQMAAVHANQSRLHLSTLYETLRAAPEALRAGS